MGERCDYDPDEHEEALDETDEREEFGCVFPGKCCMPGPHFTDECHTVAMIEGRED
jgi:hypothetical protein